MVMVGRSDIWFEMTWHFLRNNVRWIDTTWQNCRRDATQLLIMFSPVLQNTCSSWFFDGKIMSTPNLQVIQKVSAPNFPDSKWGQQWGHSFLASPKQRTHGCLRVLRRSVTFPALRRPWRRGWSCWRCRSRWNPDLWLRHWEDLGTVRGGAPVR